MDLIDILGSSNDNITGPSSSSNGFQRVETPFTDEEVLRSAGPKRNLKRGAAWDAWEDRALAKQVLADDPIMNKTGKREDRWQRVSDNLKRVGMDRSWLSCKDRMERLVKWHRQAESFSKQKTGAVEEVNEHLRNMIDVVLLYDSVSSNDLLKQAAKKKLATRKVKGVQIRQASQQGLVRKRDLMDAEGSESELDSSKKNKRPKNQFAKEVDGVIGGLHEKAEEFRAAIQEKGERDRNLSSKLDELIDTTRNTNQTMEKLMNLIIQNSQTTRHDQ